MTFDDAAMLFLLGGLGFTLLFFAFAGGLPDKRDVVTKAYVGFMAVWAALVTIAAALQ